MRMIALSFTFLLLYLSFPAVGQSYLTWPHNKTAASLVPNGCLVTIPTTLPPPSDQIFIDDTIAVEDILGETQEFRIRIWRHGCHEPNRSAILMNIDAVGTDIIRLHKATPVINLVDPINGEIFAATPALWGLDLATLYETELGLLGGSEEAFPFGTTYIVDSNNLDAIDLYNNDLNMQLKWSNQFFTAPIPRYEDDLDLPQSPNSIFHGRYSGQWVVDGLPRSGLILQIGEIPNQDRNFIFAIWFTYLDGAPIWVVGNVDIPLGTHEIEIEMLLLEGGEIFTSPETYADDEVSVDSVGTMTLRAMHCNRIEGSVDLSRSGLGSKQNIVFNRLIRIAGYDCDETQ